MRTITIKIFLGIIILSTNVEAQTSYWPKLIPIEQGSFTIYAPSIETFNENQIGVRAPFNYYDGTSIPVFGALWLKSNVRIDKARNHVLFDEIEMIDVNFPDITSATKKELANLIKAVAPTWQFNTDLDNFISLIKDNPVLHDTGYLLKNDPPNIFYETEYSELIYVDGEPILENIDNSELYQYVVNTPYFIVRSSSDNFYYLKAGNWWYRTENIYYDWKNIEQPPQTIVILNRRAEEYKLQNNNALSNVNSSKPKLLLSIHPAELIQTNGDPDLEAIQGTDLYNVANSSNDLLFDGHSKEYYVLFSGRWYRSSALFRGKWIFVEPDSIPVYFKKLPSNSVYSRYRLSIPGTPESMSAALDNAIPQTAIIDRSTARIDIEYDGEPQFETIEGTDIKYAVNTNMSVIQLNRGKYYAVDQAVWFESDSPITGWQVATSVPVEVNHIPPISPVFNIRFVSIYEVTDDLVYVGYTGGYTGSFLYQGCVFYGTGYQYKPWYKNKYFSRPTTFAFGVNRTYSNSNISIGVGVGYGYPGFYSPYGYGYGFGSYGYTHLNGNFEYKKGYAQKPFDPVNIYNNRTQGVVISQLAQRNNPYKVIPSQQEAPDGSWIPPVNLYTDKSGNVYKQDDTGDWYQRADGVWVKIKAKPAF